MFFERKPFEELRSIGAWLADYARNLVAFLTFNTEELPWPFAERDVVPGASVESAEPGPGL